MEIKTKLMQKIGIMSTNISMEFIQLEVEDRIPTVAAISEKYETSRGTVQSALKILQDYGAIKLEPRGHLGTYITYIDYLKLLEFVGINSLVGVMPLPYSKRYEGLATGIFNNLNDAGISLNFAFMRGANHRLKALKDGRYNFAITSKLTADCYIKNNEPIKIISSFGKYSYVNEHVLLIRENFTGEFTKESRIGIDRSSIDQELLTLDYFDKYNVKYINMSYSQLTSALKNGTIDAAIWNKDDIEENNINLKFLSINKNNIKLSDTEAVIIVDKNNNILQKLFNKKLNEKKVLKYQESVLKGLIMPNY